MDIKRIDSYEDSRFEEDILRQHGAFLIDGKYPCSFRIVDERTAIVYCHDNLQLDEIIEEFRFFAGHVTRFCDEKGILLKEYPSVTIFDLPLGQIQPSQFYVDRDKLEAVSSFVERAEDVVIPVTRWETVMTPVTQSEDTDKYISQDGHTRMYCAYQKGIRTVKAFLAEEEGGYIKDFAEEARCRRIYAVSDMEVLSHEGYVEKWHRYCDEYFEKR